MTRFVAWLAVALTGAWLGTALFAGAGVAAADESSGVENGSGSTSQPARTTGVSAGTDRGDAGSASADAAESGDSDDAPDNRTGVERQRRVTRTPVEGVATAPQPPAPEPRRGVVRIPAADDEPAAEFEAAPAAETAVVTQTAVVAEAERPPVAEIARPATSPTIINVVGTLFFTALDAVVRFFEGPASVPAGRAVRVSRQPLQIDEVTTVDADWYFPTLTEPDKLIYLQHGAFARAGLYNTTAADLSELNNAIVVAPSITTNFFAYDGRQLGGEPMHAAVARLFLGDRRALTASAQLAGWQRALPERFVIAGHSGGGQLAAGAAGYYAQFAPAEDVHDMAGVLLLDTSPVGGAVERGVRKIPWDIPVYSISAAPGPLNTYGGVDEVLARIRPGFVGVQLIGGTHGDSWHTTNPFAELIVGLGTGFPTPQNAAAVNVLIEGWIADWYDGTHDGYYGERGETITIATPAGPAQAYVIPGPIPRLNPIDQIIKALFESAASLSVFGAGTPV